MNDKFGTNPWNIVNDSGIQLTPSYIRAYIACYCRGEKFEYNRKANLDFFSSNEFLKDFNGAKIGNVCRFAKDSARWHDVQPKAPVAPKAQELAPYRAPVIMTKGRGVITVKNLKVVAHAKRTARRFLWVDGNGEYWTNAVHGGSDGTMHVQSEWRDEANASNLRSKFCKEFGVVIKDSEIIHITPCHPRQVAEKQGAELLNANILVEGDWDCTTWVSWNHFSNNTVNIGVSSSRSKASNSIR